MILTMQYLRSRALYAIHGKKIDDKLKNVTETAKDKLPYTTVEGKYGDMVKKDISR